MIKDMAIIFCKRGSVMLPNNFFPRMTPKLEHTMVKINNHPFCFSAWVFKCVT